MRLSPSNIRNWVNSLVLLVGSLGAHLLGGGGLVTLNNFLLDFFLILILIARVHANAISPQKLAVVVVLVQSCGHFVLGGMNQSNVVMALSHIIFGFASYQFITHSEKMWESFATLLYNLFLKKFDYHFQLIGNLQISQELSFNIRSQKDEDSHHRRGPPFKIEKALA